MSPPSTSSALEEIKDLEALLKRAPPLNLTPDDLETVLDALATRSKAYTLALAILARFLSPSPTSTTRSSLHATLESLLAGTDSRDLTRGLAALSAVLQVAPPFAQQLLKSDSLRSHLEDAVALISQPLQTHTSTAQERPALVELLALAAGHAGMRALVRRSAGGWLEALLGVPGEEVRVEDARVKALAAVAVVKLRMGKDEGAATGVPQVPEAETAPSRWTIEELTRLAVRLVPLGVRGKEPDDEVLLPALEALAYLTLYPSPDVKKMATDTALLDALFGLPPKQPIASSASSSAREYAIATFLDHLAAFPVPDAEGDSAQVERLKQFAAAAAAKGAAGSGPQLESVESITARITLLVRHEPSPIPTVRQLCLSPSLQTRRLAARILHSLVTPQPLRGALLQAGAARLFLSLIRQLPAPFSPADDTPAPQGLAKLLITANPLLVLGPTADSPLLLEAATALALPLGAPASAAGGSVDLLPYFEALMALTNLASLSPFLADSLARMTLRDRPRATRLLAVLADEHLLSTHTMLRRAAAELVCNLVASDAGIEFFEPAPPPAGTGTRLHVLLALASAEDTPTRLAATGALTSLVYSPKIVATLLGRDKWVELLLAPLGDAEPGVRHRAYEVWRVVGEAVRLMNGAEKEPARAGLAGGKVNERLEEAREKERVVELKEVAAAAVEAVRQA